MVAAFSSSSLGADVARVGRMRAERDGSDGPEASTSLVERSDCSAFFGSGSVTSTLKAVKSTLPQIERSAFFALRRRDLISTTNGLFCFIISIVR